MGNNLTLGLDIGIASVGWAVVNQKEGKLVDMGIRLFETATEASEPRKNRSARRNIRRNKWRREQMKTIFMERGLITKEEFEDLDFLSFTVDNDKYNRPQPDTVYHLRAKALREKVSKRELLICLYNICKTRGHFLLESIDFSKDGVSYDVFRERFFSYTSNYVSFKEDTSEFEDKVLKPLFNSEIKVKKDIDQLFKNYSFTNNEEEADLKTLVYLLKGYKGDLNKISEVYDAKSLTVMDLKKKTDELTELEEHIVELFDLINIAKILSEGCNYLSEVAVKKLDGLKKAFLDGKDEPAKYVEYKKDLQNKNSSSKHLRAVKNLDNSYPNGLYVKEAVDILKCQQQYYPEIDDSFIEICSSIISARIPYYIGPLSEKGKNAWVKKNNTFKYSFDYSIKHFDSVNIYESIREWKKSMVSHCTYLPEYEAMPKGSFIGETFSILNEINSFDNSTTDINGQQYYLTRDDKIKILDELFLKKDGDITFSDVESLLGLSHFGSKNSTVKKFNNKYTLYRNISRIIERLKINTILEIFNDKDKIVEIEQLILDINLFDEEKSKKDYFDQDEKYSAYSKQLSKLKSTSFYNLSREFIMNEKVDPEGSSIMDKLFEDNVSEYTNNMMYIINNAFDQNGVKIDFVSNKYLRLLKENENNIDINLLIDNGKPVIPVSRPTIRALNEAFKIYTAVIETYGVPDRVVIETARGKDSIKDHTVIDEKGEFRLTKIENLYNHLVKQIEESKIDDYFFNGVHADDISEIVAQFNNNKDKIELYVRQNGIDLMTGKPISLTNLHEYEIDHILPRGFQDDSMNDKMLIHKLVNGKKSNRLPIEFLQSPDAKEFTTMTVSRFEKIVNGLFDMDLISENKRNRLLMVSSKEVERFVKQNLVDTRYIISEFMSAVNAYNSLNNFESKIVALKGAFTSTFRKTFYIDKDRDLGNQHHAIDAAMLCVTDACLSAYFPHYDERGDFASYSNFIKETILNEENNSDNTKEKDKNRNTISYAYYKAYGHNYKRENSLINQIKNTVPLYSHKVEKNWRGALTEATLHKPLSENDKTALSIIGMNNSKRSFSGVNCVAVDFYKIKNSKGKTQHIAIHIPYAIVDNRGYIMKDKYLALVKNYYGVSELIDDTGNIKEQFFRFRAFKNDIIYDTCTNTPQLFNIGSIALKKLELKQIINFSYKSIFAVASEMAYLLAKRFSIKYGKNQGVDFRDVSINELISYVNENIYEIGNFSNFEKTIRNRLKDEKNLISLCRKYVYLASIANRNNVPPTIDGQYLPTVNNNTIKNDEDAEYVKLKYDILGLRFGNSVNGKLIINSAHGTCGKYTKVKREKFDWKISKYVVE